MVRRWATTRRTVHGVPVVVVNSRTDVETDTVLERLDAVLRLVAEFQPRRYRKLLRDVAGFEVRRFACRGAFFPETRTCLVELTFLGKPGFSDAQVAASVIHEATHARLHRLGLSMTGPAAERACRRAEVAFGRVVPGGDVVVARAEETMAGSDEEVAPAVDWDLARRRVAAADLEAMAAPSWLKRAIARRAGLKQLGKGSFEA
jgi:hypothetical protein